MLRGEGCFCGWEAAMFFRVAALAALLMGVAWLTGCSREDPLKALYEQSTYQNRGETAKALAEAWRAKEIKLSDAVDLAHEKIETDADARCTAFTGAVLDTLRDLYPELPSSIKGDEMLIFWRRVGQLAARSGSIARDRGDIAEARSLVLGGPRRWQDEAYWLTYPGHDALASYVLYETGERMEAMQRLRDRGTLTGPAEEAYRQITGLRNPD